MILKKKRPSQTRLLSIDQEKYKPNRQNFRTYNFKESKSQIVDYKHNQTSKIEDFDSVKDKASVKKEPSQFKVKLKKFMLANDSDIKEGIKKHQELNQITKEQAEQEQK